MELAFMLIGGLGLFFFGMQFMSEGLKKVAGDRLKNILRMVTKLPIIGILVGTAITCLIQSSSATTVMVVGFVNAGLLALKQAISVVLGANIGTTFTAWLVSSIAVFKITNYALPAVGIGLVIKKTAMEETITTRKAPRSIKGAPYLLENNIDVEKITRETLVFEGNALDAVKGFPKNINVSALLSISGIGPEKTKVRIIVSPKYTKNIHEIEVNGKAGTIRTRTENVPSPDNPKTSYLAVLAAIASLRGYFDSVRIGT